VFCCNFQAIHCRLADVAAVDSWPQEVTHHLLLCLVTLLLNGFYFHRGGSVSVAFCACLSVHEMSCKVMKTS